MSGQVIAATTTYNQIANEDLENLGLQTCAAGTAGFVDRPRCRQARPLLQLAHPQDVAVRNVRGLQTCAAGEDLLQDANEDVAEGRGDEHSVQRHLQKNPLRTKMLTSGVLSGLQELLASWIAHDVGKHFRLVRPAKIFCRMPMRTWPRGAATNIPYSDILGMRELK
jgi:hypothetical protein